MWAQCKQFQCWIISPFKTDRFSEIYILFQHLFWLFRFFYIKLNRRSGRQPTTPWSGCQRLSFPNWTDKNYERPCSAVPRLSVGLGGQLSQGCASQITAPKATFSQPPQLPVCSPNPPSQTPFTASPLNFIRGLISIQIKLPLSPARPNWPVFSYAWWVCVLVWESWGPCN